MFLNKLFHPLETKTTSRHHKKKTKNKKRIKKDKLKTDDQQKKSFYMCVFKAFITGFIQHYEIKTQKLLYARCVTLSED